jgi:hypothetical protein
VEAEEIVRVVSLLDTRQPLQVGSMVRARPVFEIRVREVRVRASGPPRALHRPRAPEPAQGAFLLDGPGVRLDGDRMLEQEELLAVGEGRGLCRQAVVGAAPGREVQLSRLARFRPLTTGC